MPTSIGDSKALRTKHIDTLQVLEDYSKDKDRLETENRDLRERLEEMGGSKEYAYVKGLEKEVRFLRDWKDQSGGITRDKDEEIARLKKGSDSKATDNDRRFSELVAFRDKELEDEKAKAARQLADMHSRNSELRQANEALKTQHLQEKEDSDEMCQALNHRIDQLESALEKHKSKEDGELAMEQRRERRSSKALSDTAQELDAMREQVIALNAQMQRGRAALVAAEEAARTKAAAQEAVRKALQDKNAKLQKELSKLKSGTLLKPKPDDDLAARNSLLARLDSQVTELSQENNELKGLLDVERSRVQQLLAELDALRRQANPPGGKSKKQMFTEHIALKRENERLNNVIALMQNETGKRPGRVPAVPGQRRASKGFPVLRNKNSR